MAKLLTACRSAALTHRMKTAELLAYHLGYAGLRKGTDDTARFIVAAAIRQAKWGE